MIVYTFNGKQYFWRGPIDRLHLQLDLIAIHRKGIQISHNENIPIYTHLHLN